MSVINPILANDSYKLSHREQTPGTCTQIYSHLTPRFVKYLKAKFPTMPDKVVVFGVQLTIQTLQERWQEGFFDLPWEEVEKNSITILKDFLGMTVENLQHFKALHELGYLPLKFKALPEGSHVNINIPVMIVTNTHPDFYWLTNLIEPSILNTIFKPMTVATLSLELANLRNHYFNLSSTSTTDYALHDFSYRGQSGHESAADTVLAYLLYTKGTDTMSAIERARTHYDANPQNIAGSIPALEHSTATLGIQFFKNFSYEVIMEEFKEVTDQYANVNAYIAKRYSVSLDCAEWLCRIYYAVKRYEAGAPFPITDKEIESRRLFLGEALNLTRLIIDVYPGKVFAYVSDSYDYERLLNVILPILKPVINAFAGKVVIRPDSGNPVEVVTGIEGLDEETQIAIDFLNLPTDVHFSYKGNVYLKVKQPPLDEGMVLPMFLLLRGGFAMQVESTALEVYPLGYKAKGSVAILADIFGATPNSKGYLELNSKIGLVYGDGMNYTRIKAIYENLTNANFAASNVVLSGGAYMLANLTRDDLGFAIKASAAVVNGQLIPVYKAPATDSSKTSAKGFFKITQNSNGDYLLQDNVTDVEEAQGLLQTVWEDGKFVKRTTFDEIKARLPLN